MSSKVHTRLLLPSCQLSASLSSSHAAESLHCCPHAAAQSWNALRSLACCSRGQPGQTELLSRLNILIFPNKLCKKCPRENLGEIWVAREKWSYSQQSCLNSRNFVAFYLSVWCQNLCRLQPTRIFWSWSCGGSLVPGYRQLLWSLVNI